MRELKLTDKEWHTLQTAVYIVREMQAKDAKAARQASPDFVGELAGETNLRRINKLAKLVEV